jgi:hypothetical protein
MSLQIYNAQVPVFVTAAHGLAAGRRGSSAGAAGDERRRYTAQVVAALGFHDPEFVVGGPSADERVDWEGGGGDLRGGGSDGRVGGVDVAGGLLLQVLRRGLGLGIGVGAGKEREREREEWVEGAVASEEGEEGGGVEAGSEIFVILSDNLLLGAALEKVQTRLYQVLIHASAAAAVASSSSSSSSSSPSSSSTHEDAGAEVWTEEEGAGAGGDWKGGERGGGTHAHDRRAPFLNLRSADKHAREFVVNLEYCFLDCT